jgi:hypothetical protein
MAVSYLVGACTEGQPVCPRAGCGRHSPPPAETYPPGRFRRTSDRQTRPRNWPYTVHSLLFTVLHLPRASARCRGNVGERLQRGQGKLPIFSRRECFLGDLEERLDKEQTDIMLRALLPDEKPSRVRRWIARHGAGRPLRPPPRAGCGRRSRRYQRAHRAPYKLSPSLSGRC